MSLIAIDDDEARDRGGGDGNGVDGASKRRQQKNEARKRGSGFYFLYVYTYVKKNGTLRSHTRTLYRDICLLVHTHSHTNTHNYTNKYFYTRQSRRFFSDISCHSGMHLRRTMTIVFIDNLLDVSDKEILKNSLNKLSYRARAFQIVRIVGKVMS